MKIERTKNAKRNIFFGFITNFYHIVIPFVMRTAMIYFLGIEYLGLNSLFASILSVLNLAELGIGSAMVFSMYKPIAEEDTLTICALMRLYKAVYRVIGLVIAIFGLILLPFIPKLINGSVPDGLDIYILYLLNLGTCVLSYWLFAYKNCLLSAHQRNDVTSKISMFVSTITYILAFCTLYFLHDYYAYLIVSLVMQVVTNVMTACVTTKMFPQYKCYGNVEKETVNNIIKKVRGIFLIKIGNVVLSSVDTIVISAFLGLKELAIYQNYYYIIASIMGFFAVIQNSITASVGNSVVVESVEKNYKDFTKFNLIYLWLVVWCSACYCCLVQPFMKLWVGRELMLSTGMVFLFTTYFFVYKWLDMTSVYQMACGLWWETRWIPLIAAIVNLITNIILVQVIGLAGILISTIISILFIYDIGFPYHIFKNYFKENGSFKGFVYRQIKYLLYAIIAIGVTSFICSFIKGNPIVELLVRGCVCIVIPNVILWNFLRNTPEFHEAKKFSLILIKRK